jgi:Holliday junction resolvasome RuvABC endonuclease subunit
MGGKGLTYQIGEWGGILRLEAWRRGIQVITVTPSTLKYAATGSGAGKGKEPMVKACLDLFDEVIPQDDEADAFLLARLGEAYLHHVGPKVFVDRVLEKAGNTKPGISVEPGMRRII